MTTATMATGTTTRTAGAESELRTAARRRGLTMKELAALMGVGASYLSRIANGGSPWTPKMREKVAAVLGEVPGQGTVYRQGGVVTGESSFIRERARTLGMTMKDLADEVGVSYSYMTQVARGRQNMGVKVQTRVESALHGPAKVAPAKCANRQGVVVAGESSYIRERARELGMNLRDLADRVGVSYGYMSMVARGHSNMGVKVQARVASALEAPVKVAPAQPASIDREAMWDRMDAHGFSQNEVARRAGISSAYLSQHHERQVRSVGGRAEGAARCPVPADEGGAGHARRGEGAGLAEGRAERDGGARRGRAWAPGQVRRPRRPGRRPRALGREGGVRLPRRVRRPWPVVGHARGRAGLLRHAEAAGDGRRLARHRRRPGVVPPGRHSRGKAVVIAAASPGFPCVRAFFVARNHRSRAGGGASSTLTCGRRRGSAAGSAPVRLRAPPAPRGRSPSPCAPRRCPRAPPSLRFSKVMPVSGPCSGD